LVVVVQADGIDPSCASLRGLRTGGHCVGAPRGDGQLRVGEGITGDVREVHRRSEALVQVPGGGCKVHPGRDFPGCGEPGALVGDVAQGSLDLPASEQQLGVKSSLSPLQCRQIRGEGAPGVIELRQGGPGTVDGLGREMT